MSGNDGKVDFVFDDKFKASTAIKDLTKKYIKRFKKHNSLQAKIKVSSLVDGTLYHISVHGEN